MEINYAAIIEALGTLGPFIIAVVAWKGMNSWREQKKHDLKYATLDELIQNVDNFRFKFGIIIRELHAVEIGFESYRTSPHKNKYCEGENNGIVNYIVKWGDKHASRFTELLNEIIPIASTIRVQILRVKSMGFKNPQRASISNNNFVRNIHLIAGLGTLLNYDADMNWEHPDFQDNINKYTKITASDLNDQLQSDFDSFLKFYEENMKDLIH
jgi:hypothetical protein